MKLLQVVPQKLSALLEKIHHSYYRFLKIYFRSSRPEVFCRKGFLRNFAKFTGKYLCQSLFFNKVASRNFIRLWMYDGGICLLYLHGCIKAMKAIEISKYQSNCPPC